MLYFLCHNQLPNAYTNHQAIYVITGKKTDI